MNRIFASTTHRLAKNLSEPWCKLLERQTNYHRQERHLGDLSGHLEQGHSLGYELKPSVKHSQDDRCDHDSQ